MALRFVIRRIVIPAAVLIASSPVLTSALAQGGGGQQPRPPENLKFFPKDIPRDTLLNIMRGFTYALGVNCAFCHVKRSRHHRAGGRASAGPG